MTLRPNRFFKGIFGLGVAGLFIGYCFFWGQTFQDVQAAATANPLAGVEDASLEGPCCRTPVAPMTRNREEQLVGPPSRLARPTTLDLQARAENKMFRARFNGPYALSVLDGLNEMAITSGLMAQGILDEDLHSDVAGVESMLGSIPGQLPTYGYISSPYGNRRSPFSSRTVFHKGIDFAVHYGAPVYATADGVIAFAGWHAGLGRMVMIDHGHGIFTRYGHNSKVEVREGDEVRRGDRIAAAGSSGRSTGSHVHYEVWVNGRTVDPSRFMFDVPEKAGEEPLKRVVLASYQGKVHHLGLAAGGDDSEALIEYLPAYDSAIVLPYNVATVGLFVFFVVFLVGTLWPFRPFPGRESV